MHIHHSSSLKPRARGPSGSAGSRRGKRQGELRVEELPLAQHHPEAVPCRAVPTVGLLPHGLTGSAKGLREGLTRLELPKGSPAVGDGDGEGADGRNEWWSGRKGKAVGNVLESSKSSALAHI